MGAKPYKPGDFDPTAFAVLGVEETAGQAACKKAYRKLARGCHPDTHEGDAGAEARFKTLNAAYELVNSTDEHDRYVAGLEDFRSTSAFSGLFSMFGGGEESDSAREKRLAAEEARLRKAREADRLRQLAEAECHRLNALAKAEYAREMAEHQTKLVGWEKRRAAREKRIRSSVTGAARSAGGPLSDQVEEIVSRPVSAISRMFSRPRLRVGSKIIELDSTHPAPLPSAVMGRIEVPPGLNKSQAAAWRIELIRLLEAENKKR